MATAPTAEPGQISPGVWRPVDLALGDDPAFTVHGRIDYVDPALDPQTSTIRVRARFENEDEALIPGIFTRVRIFQDTLESTVVPDIALLSDQAGRYAFVLNDKDAVEVRRVNIGALDGRMRVVLDGLTPTDRMVTTGLQRARPGITVNPTLQNLESKTPAPASTEPPATKGDEKKSSSLERDTQKDGERRV
jgi:RND family efflux transporter MFP subunit